MKTLKSNIENMGSPYNKKVCCLYAAMLLILSSILGTSCTKDNLMELNKGETPLGLSVNKDTLVLHEKDAATDALTFTWTSGSNGGTNASISYVLQIDKQGNNFADPVTENLGKAAYTKTYSVKALNDSLLSHWDLTPGKEAQLEARVISSVSGNPDLSENSAVTIKVTPYQPVSTTLYLIGDATPNGWSADNATALTLSNSIPGEFTWQGHLNSGNFKFTTSLGQFLPSYNKGTDAAHLVLRTDDSQSDDQFTVSTPGVYNVTVNLLNLSLSVTEGDVPPYERLWIVGDATPSGWDISAPGEMRVDSSNLFVFNYNAVLKTGEFKIPTATGDFNTDYYMPLANHPDISETGVQFVQGGNPDLKWQITNPGPYKIKLDLEQMKISIKPFTPYTQIWMVGDATPVGWNIDNPQPMTPDSNDPYVFTYTGPLNAGEFKFPVETGDWGGDFFMPEVSGAGPGSTRMKFVPGGSPDYKWKITSPGNYKITINQLMETISIQKL